MSYASHYSHKVTHVTNAYCSRHAPVRVRPALCTNLTTDLDDVRRRNIDCTATLSTRQETGYAVYFRCVPLQISRGHRVTPVPIANSSQLSKKRSLEDSDTDNTGDSEEDADIDEEADYAAPKPSQPRKKPAEKAATPAAAEKPPPKKRGRPPGPGKPRAPRAAAIPQVKARRRPRKGAAEFDAEQVAKETKINNDNPLFSQCPFHAIGLG
jgi:hypothetical protein